MDKTQPLPTAWRQDFPASTPEPRRRYPRNTASLATTTQMPVVGRAGTRERVLASDACFGGGEVNS